MMPRRILVVEDETTMRQLLVNVLTRAGFFVTAAASYVQAWRELRRSNYDVLLTDVRLPDNDGRALLKRVPITTRVVTISGFQPIEPFPPAGKVTPFRHLVKPLDLSELVEVLR
jgi:DNA-binding NtrC family response regulator